MRLAVVGLLALSLVGAGLISQAQARNIPAAIQSDCRVVEMDPRRGPPRVVQCRDQRGAWVPRPDMDPNSVQSNTPAPALAPIAQAALPADWRGEIRYTGTHQGYVQPAGSLPTRLTPDALFGSLQSSMRQQYGGQIDLVLQFDGSSVSGTYSGTGGMETGRVSGTRNGSQCRLTAGGNVIEATCSQNVFEGTSRSMATSGETQFMRIAAQQTSLVDFSVRDRQRAEQRVEAQRVEANETARVAALRPASAAQTAMLTRVLERDATQWANGGIRSGSIRGVRVGDASGQSTLLRAEYLSEYGQWDWVEARVRGNVVECLQYSGASSCRAPLSPPRGVPNGTDRPLSRGEGVPTKDIDGSEACLRQAEGSESTRVHRVRPTVAFNYDPGDDTPVEATSGRTFTIKNTCNRAVSYLMTSYPPAGGAARRVEYSLPARREQAWNCHYDSGESVFGNIVSQLSFCERF